MDAFKLVALGLVAMVAAYAADQGQDIAFRMHGLLIMLIAAGMFIWQLRRLGEPSPQVEQGTYKDDVVRAGVLATAFWGIAGLAVGTLIAFQLAFPSLNVEWAQPYGNFGRLRPKFP